MTTLFSLRRMRTLLRNSVKCDVRASGAMHGARSYIINPRALCQRVTVVVLCVCVYVCVRACVRACVHACVLCLSVRKPAPGTGASRHLNAGISE